MVEKEECLKKKKEKEECLTALQMIINILYKYLNSKNEIIS